MSGWRRGERMNRAERPIIAISVAGPSLKAAA